MNKIEVGILLSVLGWVMIYSAGFVPGVIWVTVSVFLFVGAVVLFAMSLKDTTAPEELPKAVQEDVKFTEAATTCEQLSEEEFEQLILRSLKRASSAKEFRRLKKLCAGNERLQDFVVTQWDDYMYNRVLNAETLKELNDLDFQLPWHGKSEKLHDHKVRVLELRDFILEDQEQLSASE